MHSIDYFVPSDRVRKKTINYGQYQEQGPGNLNYFPSSHQPPGGEEITREIVGETNLSPKNKKLADYLTELTLKFLRIETNKKEFASDVGSINSGLDYFI